MNKLVLTALAGVAAVSAAVITPSKAEAQVSIGIGIGGPGGYATPVQWGGGYYGRPYRPYRPGFYGPPRPYGYGIYRPYRPAYVAPSCWVERRWVDTPWGPEPRRVRICR
jgi:hypothetical protein